MTYAAIGMEVNISYLAVTVTDLAGDTLFSAVEKDNFRSSDPKYVLPRLGEMVRQWSPPKGCCITGTRLCIPGLTTEDKTILTAPNLGWKNVVPETYLSLPDPISLGCLMNEADAAAYSMLYSAPGSFSSNKSFLYVSGEVGVGASIMFNSKLFSGSHNWAGEIGHMCVDPAGPLCRCGSNGCLEQFVGQDALLKAAGLPENSTFTRLLASYKKRESKSIEAIDQANKAISIAISNALNLLDLDVVIFGGNLAALLDFGAVKIEKELKKRLLNSKWSETRLLTNPHGFFSASKGACYAALEAFIENPSLS
ncbi:ROK family protein [Gleimia hominis]|uniref:ROK family protein n=1 Tax=Gleimia hominis TaxID=595468 RepID=UPI000C809C2F|nr:ROK family protein [Gleimia hominis]WIK63913.1 ROK family protein [Gleimia hominis]